MNEDQFKDSISIFKSSTFYSTIESKNEYSIYLNNRELKLTTLKFQDTKERVISMIEKELSQNDLDNFIDYMNINYPEIKKNEIDNTDNTKDIFFIRDGLYIWISENKSDKEKYSNWDERKYNFHYSDFYTLSEILLKKIGQKYKLIEDNHLILNKNN
jgi:broad specificity polyphosphatase/5'/3'-nucleotidase SurE